MCQLAEDLGRERLPYFSRSRVLDESLAHGFLIVHRALESQDPGRRHELLIQLLAADCVGLTRDVDFRGSRGCGIL